jgi:hypothetical protein
MKLISNFLAKFRFSIEVIIQGALLLFHTVSHSTTYMYIRILNIYSNIRYLLFIREYSSIRFSSNTGRSVCPSVCCMHSVFAYFWINFAWLATWHDCGHELHIKFEFRPIDLYLQLWPLNLEFSMKFLFHGHFMEFYGLCLQVHCIETIFGMVFTVISYRSIWVSSVLSYDDPWTFNVHGNFFFRCILVIFLVLKSNLV